MSTVYETLTKPFQPEQYKSFEGRGGRRFTYVDDESVMTRLDEAFGPDGWDIEVEPIGLAGSPVKVTIIAGGTKRSDFGYPTNGEDGEPLKEAVSDGIRRVGRMFGIARDVYEGKVAPGGGAQAPRTAPVAAQPAITTPAPSPAEMVRLVGQGVDPRIAQAAQQVFGEDARVPQAGDPCPIHQVPLNGGQKGPADLFHANGELPNGKKAYCRPYAPPRGR